MLADRARGQKQHRDPDAEGRCAAAAVVSRLTLSISWSAHTSPLGMVSRRSYLRGQLANDKSMEDAADRIGAHYERHALSWDADRRGASWTDKPFIERFLSLLPSGSTILDLGCGGGSPVALQMAAQGFRVTGVDSSPTLISLCQKRMPDQDWIVADMRSLALGRRFGGILAWDSFFHLRHKDQETMFRIFAAHAAPDAVLMLTPALAAARSSARTEAILCTMRASIHAEYEALLAGHGFELIEHSINDLAKGGQFSGWLAR